MPAPSAFYPGLQPDGITIPELNDRNPLTRGLVSAVLPLQGFAVDVITGQVLSETGTGSYVATERGWAFEYANAYLRLPKTPLNRMGAQFTTMVGYDTVPGSSNRYGVWNSDGYGIKIYHFYGTFQIANLSDRSPPGAISGISWVNSAGKDGKFHSSAITFDSNTAKEIRCCFDGVDQGVPLTGLADGVVYGGAYNDSSGYNFGDALYGDTGHTNHLYYHLQWNRPLTESEIKSVHENPWQLFSSGLISGVIVAAALTSLPSGGVEVLPGVEQILVTGSAPSLELPITVSPGTEIVQAVGLSPIVITPNPITVSPGVEAVEIVGSAPTIELPVGVSPGTELIEVAGFAPTVFAGAAVEVLPATELVEVAGFTPVVQIGSGVVVSPATEIIHTTGFAPTVEVSLAVIVSPGLELVQVLGMAPVVELPVTVSPATEMIEVFGLTPTIGAPVVVAPALEIVEVAGLAPVVETPINVNPAPELVIVTGFSPSLDGPPATPARRRLMVGAESRSLRVASDNRSILIDHENRKLVA